MGPYMSHPNKTKETYHGEHTTLAWAASAMQGKKIKKNKKK